MRLVTKLAREKKLGGLPVWVWVICLAPWSIGVFLNPYFWDDWLISQYLGVAGQFEFWAGAAKHPANPFIFGSLLFLGPWAFHVLSLGAAVVAAHSTYLIVMRGNLLAHPVAPWIQAIFLALPVFHARFSIATFEYILALASILLAWAMLLDVPSRIRSIASIALMIFAIGVPSTAVIFLVMWIHITLRSTTSLNWKHMCRSGLRWSYILMIPALFSLTFRFVIDSRGKFQVSSAALSKYMASYIFLCGVLAFSWFLLRRRFPNQSQLMRVLFITTAVAYLGLLPYYAVGYNPLSDFLPWRARTHIISEHALGMVLACGVVAIAGLATYVVARRASSSDVDLGAKTVLLVVYIISVGAVVLGPMDWESRHWLISWPFISVAIAVLIGMTSVASSRIVHLVSVSLLLAATTVISSEYVADARKQKALVASAEREILPLLPEVRSQGADSSRLLIVVQWHRRTHSLNARFRRYRGYEWSVMLQTAVAREGQIVGIFENPPDRALTQGLCRMRSDAIIVSPHPISSFVEALVKPQLEVAWSPRVGSLCLDGLDMAWPRPSSVESWLRGNE